MGVVADGDIACVLNSRYGHVERRDACKNPRQQRPLFHFFFFRSQSGTHLSPMGIRHHQSGSLSVGHAESKKNLIYLVFFCVLLRVILYRRSSCLPQNKSVDVGIDRSLRRRQ